MSEEYKLELHLMLMRSVYMMEAGHIMNKFYQRLFHEVYYKYKIFNIQYIILLIIKSLFKFCLD